MLLRALAGVAGLLPGGHSLTRLPDPQFRLRNTV
jgi:hypothetical protein